MLDSIAIIILSASLSGLTTYFVGKLLIKDTKKGIIKQIPEILPELTGYFIDDLTDFLHTEEGAKMFYGIGALIGNGAKAGFGLTKKSGKFRWEDLLMQIAGQYIGFNPGQGEQTQPLNQSEPNLYAKG